MTASVPAAPLAIQPGAEPLCARCGGALPAAWSWCAWCGLHRAAADRAAAPLSWTVSIPILTSRFALWDLARALIASVAVTQVGAYAVSRLSLGKAQLIPWPLLLGVIGLIACLAVVVVLVVFQNHYHARFRIGPAGVAMALTTRERRINRVLFWAGLLAGKPQVVGAAMIAESQEAKVVDWHDIHRVTVHRRPRVITLSGSQRTQIRLFCPPEAFDEAVARCQASLAAAERLRRACGEDAPRPWSRWLLTAAVFATLTLLAGVATWPDGTLAPVALGSGALAVLLVPLHARWRAPLALGGLIAAAVAAMLLGREAWQAIPYPWGGGLRALHYQPWWLARTAAGTLALLAVHTTVLIGLLARRKGAAS